MDLGILTGGFSESRRRQDGLAALSFFSTSKRPAVACSGRLPSKARGWAALGGSGGAPCPEGGARAALNSLGGGLQWNRRLGVEFQEVTGAILYIGGSYVMMRRDSTTKLISNSLLKFIDSVRIRFSSSWG
jgi:hypothetical protein